MKPGLNTLPLLLLCVACNRAPGPVEIAISPAEPLTGDDLAAQIHSEALDEDGDSISYRFAWSQDEATRSDLTAQVVPSTETAKGEVWRVTVTAFDGELEGPAATTAVAIGNTAPTATVEFAPAEPLSTEDLEATVTGEDPDGDDLSYSWAWAVDGEPTEHTGATVPAADTTRGQVWTVTVVPSDGDDDGEPASASVNVENTPPVVDALSIEPTEPTEESTLQATVVASDDDGDTVELSYAWSVDGVLVLEGAEDSLSGEHFDRDQQVLLEVTPNDGFVEGEPVQAEPVTILNSPPSITSVSLEPSEIYEASTVSCVAQGWADADGDAEGYRYTWTVDGSEVSTDETLDGSAFDRGDTLSCTLTPSDGTDDGEPLSSASTTVLNTPPSLVSASLSPTDPTEADTLSVSLGKASDDDGDPISYAYAWTVNGARVSTAEELSGASFDRDDEVVCEITPNDGAEDGPTVTTAAVTVVNTPPVATSVLLSPSDPRTDDLLEATATATDADGDSVTWTWSWSVDGVRVTATDSSLDGESWFDKGQTVLVEATPFDGADSGAAISSSTVLVGNSPPSISAASVSPAEAYEGSTLSCLGIDWTDADDDTESYEISWTVNGYVVSTSATIDGALFDRGDSVRCMATPDDGTDTGTTRSSDPVTVRNSPPSFSGVSISPSAPTVSDAVSASVSGAADDDGDSVQAELAWYVDGSLVSQGVTLPGSAFSKGDNIQVIATPYDGADRGSPVSSSTVTAANSIPAITTVAISPSDPETDDEITVAITTSDDDGDVVSANVEWYVAGARVSALGASLDGASWFSKHDTVYAVLTPNDGEDDGAPVTTSTVTVVNAPPTAPELEILPAQPEQGVDDLVCGITAGSTDADGDSVSYSVTWLADGVSFSGTTTTMSGDTVLAADTASASSWRCSVTPHDGEEAGSAGQASVVFGLWNEPELELEEATVVLTGDESNEYAAGYMAAAGDVDGDGLGDLLVGASSYDGSIGSDAGRACLFLAASLPAAGSAALSAADSCFEGPQTMSYVGQGLTGGSDIDGDGYDDFAIGVPIYDYAETELGEVAVFLGGTTSSLAGLDFADADYLIEGDQPGGRLGQHLTMGGDIDGDGLGDLALALSRHAPLVGSATRAGWVYLFPGDSLDTPGTISAADAPIQISGEDADYYAGRYMSFLDDVDGDGLDDLAMGAYTEEEGTNTGSAYIMLAADMPSSGTGWVTDASYAFYGEAEWDSAGELNTSAGDLDGDGLGDLWVSAKGNDESHYLAGKVYLILSSSLGSPGTVSLTTADAMILGDASYSEFGGVVAALDDMDGDGLPEATFGAKRYDSYSGQAYLFLGATVATGGTISAADADHRFWSSETGAYLGSALAAPGDMDGNGSPDLAIGAALHDAGVTDGGAAFLFFTP